MSIVCPKCNYTRQPTDTAPDYECPKCGVIYAKATLASSRKNEPSISANQNPQHSHNEIIQDTDTQKVGKKYSLAMIAGIVMAPIFTLIAFGGAGWWVIPFALPLYLVVAYDNSTKNKPVEKKTLSLPLVLGCLFLPPIVGWVLLLRGYTNTQRMLAFAPLVLLVTVVAYLAPRTEVRSYAPPGADLMPGSPKAVCYDKGMRLAAIYVANFSKMATTNTLSSDAMNQGCEKEVTSECVSQCKIGFKVEAKRLLNQ